jgi:gas vesicle protein
MISQQRRIDDPVDPWPARQSRQGSGAATLILAALLGFGLGVLAAPQPGSQTRKLLRKRLAALGEEVGEGLGEVQEVSSKARRRARERLARLRENASDELEGLEERWQRAKSRIRETDEDEGDEFSPLSSLAALAAGVAATYFLTSERASPVRSRVQDAALDIKRRATDQWDRFQRGGLRQRREGGNAQQGQPEARTGSTSSEEPPQAS